jgi:hypothetical protein
MILWGKEFQAAPRGVGPAITLWSCGAVGQACDENIAVLAELLA